MAKDHGPSIKDDEQYEKLRKKREQREGSEDRQHLSLWSSQARRKVWQLRAVVEEGPPRARQGDRHRGTL
jgi:hypothetical protein